MNVAPNKRTMQIPGDVSAEPAMMTESPKVPRRRGRPLRLAAIVLALIAVLAFAGNWLAARWSHVFLDDARVASNLVTISSEVNGKIADVAVLAGDSIEKGAAMVSIDPEQAELELRVLEAQATGLESQKNQLREQQDMIRAQVASKLEAAQAQIAAAEAGHHASEASLERARSQFERISALTVKAISSKQSLDDAQAGELVAAQQELSTAAEVEVARANLAVIKAEKLQVAVLDRQIATLDAQLSALKAQQDQKRIDLAKRSIQAAFSGVIDATFVDTGEYVSPGTRLLIYHDPQNVWIDANVKETDFQRLKMGATASVKVDAYPSQSFQGKIEKLGEAATSQFALLPSPNPSGNFTKVTQRVPIRISIEQKDGLLRPGMMVEVSVDVVD
ncbi:MAG TPA: HlyD family secretion protein [Verrucomicrobiae bacterium]|nr:HlyD family secretion protein [Verrucomicrobiae bacterium]